VRNVELGDSGLQVSQLALGCMIMGTRTDEGTSVRILDDYLDQGGTFLDTANCYCWWEAPGTQGGQSEELLGRWFAADPSRRDRVVLATKGSAVPRDPSVCFDADGRPDWAAANREFEGAGADTLRQAVDGSLRRLGTDRIDLYYVHVDDRSTPLEETLEALAGLVAAGKIRHYGYSNVRAWRLARIQALCERYGWPAPVAVQQLHSYLRRRGGLADDASVVDDEQLDYLRANRQATLVAYSPILQGIYDDPAKRATSHLTDRFRGADTDARLAAVDALAAETGATPGQVVLAWLLAQDDPTIVPLIGPRTFEQYRAALPALELELSAGQLGKLDSAGA
jgi:aryl-alcohol dehydrogenase-like predicted oxidoreductase